MSLWFQGVVVLLWLGFVLVVAFTIRRIFRTDTEISRKIVHIGTGHVILFAWCFDTPAILGIVAAFIASIVTLISYYLPILPGLDSIGRKSLGTFFYSVSIGILVAFFWSVEQQYYAALGILVMCWGDGLAALVGQRFGKHKYQVFGGQKSWEGSLTVTVSSYIVCSLILYSVHGGMWQVWVIAAVVAIFATILEVFSFLGVDNLTVPLGSAFLAYLLDLNLI
ncbi:diacylglycerol/polyprenol kinase family protein [Calothrix sp. NIES-3974]|uniref:diacylglycerol/polyprenol kinase family protein n=1 Tax=Calothrix sp. NIES-3974 TaxID=2005462 RepID=UPI000B608E24|nr:diacylglycerol/polyprenol kinase family protein [Calothrix sp. NIES-3974]BAZ03850.1 phosphatidate cytidylyltransferase [Calothrix sp. NIES-3974]